MSKTKKNKLHCIFDLCNLNRGPEKRVVVEKTGAEKIFNIYRCPKCRAQYINLIEYKDKAKIMLDGIIYINITPDGDAKRCNKKRISPSSAVMSQCFVIDGSIYTYCRKCGGYNIERKEFLYKTEKGIFSKYSAGLCRKCNIYYLNYETYSKDKSRWSVLNPEHVHLLKEKEEKLEKEARKNTSLQNERGLNNVPNNENDKKQESYIGVKDLLIRRSTFMCRYKEHKLLNIDASINIIDRKGNESKIHVPAGYCTNCKVFFIMESIYQDIKRKGIPVCRISDEKSYIINTAYVNGMMLAQESLLMQYGYTVSQEEGLSSFVRKKILALLVDNGVMTRNDIISYLDFFINQRKDQSKYEKAIEKWESDREFISEYRHGDYTKIGIKGLYRRY